MRVKDFPPGALMVAKKLIFLLLISTLLGLAACGPFPPAPVTQDPAQATYAVQTQVARIVAGTLSAGNELAAQTASAIAAQTDVANRVASTLTALATAIAQQPAGTPEFTFTPSFTPSLSPSPTGTITSTPNFPRVTLGADTNCRSGPGTSYEILGLVKAGQTAEIVGQDFDHGNWVIRLPSNPVIICWIWRASATSTGNTASVPVFTPQATPTETIGFSLSYDNIISCGSNFAVKFKIVNDSDFTWESNQVILTDRTTNVTTTINRNNFTNYNGCTLAANDTNLAPGEVGFTTSNNLAANPAGHDFKAILQLCTAEGQTGTCTTETITFTP